MVFLAEGEQSTRELVLRALAVGEVSKIAENDNGPIVIALLRGPDQLFGPAPQQGFPPDQTVQKRLPGLGLLALPPGPVQVRR